MKQITECTAYDDDQMVPQSGVEFLSSSRVTGRVCEAPQPRLSIPDFDCLLQDLNNTFDFYDYNSMDMKPVVNNNNNNFFNTITSQDSNPAIVPDISTQYMEENTFYDPPVYIKQEVTEFEKPHCNGGQPLATQEQTIENDPLITEIPQQLEAMNDAKREVDNVCSSLAISPDPYQWSVGDVQKWVQWALQQFNLHPIHAENFHMDGTSLCMLSEQDFKSRSAEVGPFLSVELEIWRNGYNLTSTQTSVVPKEEVVDTVYMDLDSCNQSTQHSYFSAGIYSADISTAPKINIPKPVFTASSPSISPAPSLESLDSSTSSFGSMSPCGSSSRGSSDSVLKGVSPSKHNIHLWQFLRELLMESQYYSSCIRWVDRTKGIFKIEDSGKVARLWGQRKNRPAMNYDKLSRSIRQYYKKGIIKKTDNSKRLVYQFCPQYRI